SIKVLTKGKIAEYEFVFHPINSLKLYRLTQLRGDLAQQYYLTTDFVQTSQGEALGLPPLQFQLSDTTYQAYLAAYGQEKNLRIYQLKDDATILKEKILQHLNKKLPLASNNPSQTHSVSINEQEIMIDGAVIKLLVYSLYSSIYLQISIVNHSHYPFAIDFSQLFLVSNEKKISPANLSDPRLFSLRRTPDNKKVALLKGERLQFTFLFENLEPQETCYWLLDGIEMGEKPIRVFPSGITFEFSKKPVD
ncbi:MAG: hypothetical protein NZ521_07815, partial [Flammeovirgaceae bacterium]|nr:hypothetical protein [Flammeovirgaceae bacterium]MDW8288118.1 hypothetical protein [Flammeovirgaceae bacterium]